MLSYTEFPQNRYGIHVRLVDEGDAEFIVMLRTDSRLGKYISSTDNDVDKQKNWIKAYKSREIAGLEYYFIFEKPLGNRLGVSRIYNIAEDYFFSLAMLLLGILLLSLVELKVLWFDLFLFYLHLALLGIFLHRLLIFLEQS